MSAPRPVAVVTGASCGIGLRTAQLLADGGAGWAPHDVIVTARTAEKGAQAAAAAGAVAHVELELGDLASVRRAAARVAELSGGRGVRVLVLNAGFGSFGGPRRETADGFEAHFGCNHLGHFLLCSLLLPQLRQAAPARVVAVSSGLHDPKRQPSDGNAPLAPTVDFDNLMLREKYSGHYAYCVSKLCNVLFAYELNRRERGMGVAANAVNPGFIPGSELIRHAPPDRIAKLRSLPPQAVRSVDDGALCSVLAATAAPAAGGGGYYELSRDGELTAVRSSDETYDEAAAARLWEASTELVGAAGGRRL